MKDKIEEVISQGYKAGIEYGACGRDGSDNSYNAFQRTKQQVEEMAKKQGVELTINI